MTTIFKKIIEKEIPADIVYEDDNYLAFKDINPRAKTHILIIPKVEIESFHKIKSEQELQLVQWLFEIAHKIIKNQNLDWCRLQINSWANHGQEVFHIHLHLMSGFEK